MFVEICDPLFKFPRVGHLIKHPLNCRTIRVRLHDLPWNTPDVDEPLIVRQNLTLTGHNQNAVDGGFSLGLQKRLLESERGLGLFPL